MRGMAVTETRGCAPTQPTQAGSSLTAVSCLCDEHSDVQEEVQSAGESRRGVAAESL